MGGVPRPILIIVAIGLGLAAMMGFALGFTQSDRKATTGEAAPIAANLPSNVVIKDAQPFVPPPPPPPKVKAAASDDNSDDASDDTPEPPQTARAPAPTTEPAPTPVPPPGPPSKPGGQLPADLPPT
jgi:hypothetical protein